MSSSMVPQPFLGHCVHVYVLSVGNNVDLDELKNLHSLELLIYNC